MEEFLDKVLPACPKDKMEEFLSQVLAEGDKISHAMAKSDPIGKIPMA